MESFSNGKVASFSRILEKDALFVRLKREKSYKSHKFDLRTEPKLDEFNAHLTK